MNYCPNCGRRVEDGGNTCSYCGYDESVVIDDVQAKEISSEIIEDEQIEKGEKHRCGSESPSTLLTVLIVLAILFLPGPGLVFGIIAGVILINDKRDGYRRLGRNILILTIIVLVLWIVCCLGAGLFSFLGVSATDFSTL